MRKEIVETGKTVEDAINSACLKLGRERDDVEWEIVDLPKKALFGLKVIPAKVTVWYDDGKAEEPVVQPKPQAKPQPEALRSRQQDKPVKKEQPKRPEQKEAQKHTASEEPLSGDLLVKAETAKSYLEAVCGEMGLTARFQVRQEDGGICIEVQGQGLGAIIGRRGETLDALQYLTGLVANRLEGDYIRVTVDCGDYRTKRKSTLEALAKKLSSQVLKTNVSKTLEPMNPFERRIIHATVSEIEGVSSTSIGEEPNRRVVITSPTARRCGGGSRGDGGRTGGGRRPSGGGDRNRGGRPPRSGPPRRNNDRMPRESTQGGTINTLPQTHTPPSMPPAKPKQTPEAATSDKPLYTKLDLE